MCVCVTTALDIHSCFKNNDIMILNRVTVNNKIMRYLIHNSGIVFIIMAKGTITLLSIFDQYTDLEN